MTYISRKQLTNVAIATILRFILQKFAQMYRLTVC